MALKIIWLLTLCLGTLQFNLFNLEMLNNKTGATCLDGSPPAIYTYESDEPEKAPNKLLIYFEWAPNGWCYKEDLSSSLEECLKWKEEDYGSSNNYESGLMILSGMLSPMVEGPFQDWYKVIIKSCDGGSFLGNEDVVTVKRQKLYFRGSRVIEEVIAQLNKKGWLKDRDQVVLSGSFNGGIAAVHWSEEFQKQTKNPVKLLLDSAYYLNDLNYKHNRTTIQNRIETMTKLVLQKATLPHQKCVSSYPNELWKCFFLQQLINITDKPLFIAQSLYDSFHIEEVLGFECADIFKSLSECPEKDREIIEEYKKNVQEKVRGAASQEKNGVFGIACVLHDMTGGKFNNDIFQVPMNSGHTLSKGIQTWLKGDKAVWIDEVDWPQNSPCAHKSALNVDQKEE